MKKNLLAIAVLGALSNVAYAQSNVTIYGIVDAGIVSERGGAAGNVTKVSSGVNSASRFGFRGTEDLGNGLSAVFLIEGGFRTDTGASDTAGLFQRQSFVGLVSKQAGSLTLGRQYTPYYNTLAQVADPFAAGLAGSAKNLFAASGVSQRTSNSVLYKTPTFMGVDADVSYAVGEQAEASAGRQFGASVGYTNGPLNVRAVYNNINNDTATGLAPTVSRGIGRNAMLAANYDFKIVKAFAAYAQNKGLNSYLLPNGTAYNPVVNAKAQAPTQDSRDMLIGATVPVGSAGTLIASFINKDDKEVLNHDGRQYALGYSHALSKRTSTYVSYAKIKNKNGASYTVGNNTEAGTGDKAFNVGVKHSF
jgi:general bacterial porin, GBP family